MSHVMNTYARQPVAFVRGEGVWLWDEAGKKYLDALAGIAVSTLGYAHPKLTRALAEQAGRVLHTSNLFRIPLQETAADRIAEITGMEEVFFCNSGCEANEAAIKIARMYGHERGIAGARDHRDGEGVPRPHAGDALGHRQPQGAGGLRAAGVGLRARALRRPGGGAEGRRRTTATWSRYWSSRSRAKAASTSAASSTCAACARSATATNGC